MNPKILISFSRRLLRLIPKEKIKQREVIKNRIKKLDRK